MAAQSLRSLNGEKIRGFRANVLVLDEYLLLPEDIIKTVLMPFLVAPQNMKERLEIREIENRLIEQGAMKEEDRMVFENNSKMIALSSASYTFENLFKTYKEWMEKIQNKETTDATYFISQMSYEALPTEMVDPTIIEEAQTGGVSNSSFQRSIALSSLTGRILISVQRKCTNALSLMEKNQLLGFLQVMVLNI